MEKKQGFAARRVMVGRLHQIELAVVSRIQIHLSHLVGDGRQPLSHQFRPIAIPETRTMPVAGKPKKPYLAKLSKRNFQNN